MRLWKEVEMLESAAAIESVAECWLESQRLRIFINFHARARQLG